MIYDGIFVFCRLSSADENTHQRSGKAEIAMHSTNGYSKGVHSANGNKANLNTVFTRQTGGLYLVRRRIVYTF
jgi:hypothetical protein